MKNNLFKGFVTLSILLSSLLVGCGNTTTQPTPSNGGNPTTSIYQGDPFVVELNLVRAPEKTQYVVGETIDLTGIKVTAIWNDGIDEELSQSELTCDRSKKLTTADETFEVSYEGKSVSFPITVKEMDQLVLKDIKIVRTGKNAVNMGEKLNLNGLVVNAIYEGDRESEITDYKVSYDGTDVTSVAMSDGFEVSKGKHTVKITYQGKEESFNVYGYDASSAIVTQAENIIESQNVTDNDKFYIERDQDYNYYVEKNGSYKGKALSEFKKGDTVKVHFYLEQACTMDLYMMAATTAAFEKTLMNPVGVEYICDMSVNGVATPIENDTMHVPGTSGVNWYFYNLVCIGSVTLKAGDNVIDFKCNKTAELGFTSGNGTFNIDFFALN